MKVRDLIAKLYSEFDQDDIVGVSAVCRGVEYDDTEVEVVDVKRQTQYRIRCILTPEHDLFTDQ